MGKQLKLNVQGLSRRYEPLMSSLLPDPGYIFFSCDLASGEPTVTTEFSKDPYYHAACFGMVGKAPYYDSKNVLCIDDIYIMCMSVSPMGKAIVRKAFAADYDGLTFAEKWLQDKEYIQKVVFKKERPFHKILCLGLGYSMGPKHMVEAAFRAGYVLTLDDATAFFKAYWALFSKVKTLGKSLEARLAKQGYLVNTFGYRLVPDQPYKSLNYFIQSSVSGIMLALCYKFFAIAPYAKFVTIIHDELIAQVPIERLEEARLAMQAANDSLNDDLGWGVKIRVGFAPGGNLYEAK